MPTNNWFENNPWQARLLLFLLVLALLELGVRGLVLLGLAPYQQYPTIAGGPVFWDDIHPAVGVWRYPNREFHHQSSCFEVSYQTNAYGARDRARAKQSGAAQRVVVLGDSYVEGFGVATAARLTDLLEERTGVEHLNFGTSGSFGTIQEWQLYESLASQFEHTAVMIFLLPANDFSDNNPNDFPQARFRPYLRKNGDNFELYYTVPFEQRQREFRDWGLIIKNTIDNSSYLANFLRFANREVKSRLRSDPSAQKPEINGAHYNTYSDLDLEIMLHALRKIAERAAPRKVYLFTIPSFEDYRWAQEKGYEFRLVQDLATFADKHGNLHYLDLLPGFMAHAASNQLAYRDFTHTCDGHWNELGNRVAAETVMSFLGALAERPNE